MRRIVIVGCALAGAVVLAAGCGGKPWSQAVQSANPAARLLAAVSRTTNAHTADFTMDVKVSTDAKSAEVSGTGSIDFTNQSAQMTLNATSADGFEQGEVRLVGGKAYIRKGEVWSVADVGRSQSDALGNGDPTQYLHYLSAVSSDVHVVGDDEIDGTNVTTYGGTIDLHKLVSSSALSPAQRQSLQFSLDTLGSGLSSMPFTAALDDQGRLRKLTDTMVVSVLGVKEHIEATISYKNFGVAVNVQPPPGVGDRIETPTTSASAARSPQAVAQDRATQSDLRNALTAEKTEYTDNQAYSASTDEMATIEGSLDWGGALQVVVSHDKQSVCLSETSKSGTSFAIADVASGPDAGTYYGERKCANPLTAHAAAAMQTGWVGSQASSSSSPNGSSSSSDESDRNAKSDLRDAMTAEKTIYTDEQIYKADTKQLREIESSLPWGSQLHVYVGDATSPGDKGTVCMWELDTASGRIYSIADVAAGPNAGTFFGTTPCPPSVTPAALSSDAFNTGW